MALTKLLLQKPDLLLLSNDVVTVPRRISRTRVVASGMMRTMMPFAPFVRLPQLSSVRRNSSEKANVQIAR